MAYGIFRSDEMKCQEENYHFLQPELTEYRILLVFRP